MIIIISVRSFNSTADLEKCNTWICWFRVIFRSFWFLVFVFSSRVYRAVRNKKGKFWNITQVYWSKETWFFYSYAQKQKQKHTKKNIKQEKDGNCGETSYRFIEFYSNFKWLTFEYSRKLRESEREEVQVEKWLIVSNFFTDLMFISTCSDFTWQICSLRTSLRRFGLSSFFFLLSSSAPLLRSVHWIITEWNLCIN